MGNNNLDAIKGVHQLNVVLEKERCWLTRFLKFITPSVSPVFYLKVGWPFLEAVYCNRYSGIGSNRKTPWENEEEGK